MQFDHRRVGGSQIPDTTAFSSDVSRLRFLFLWCEIVPGGQPGNLAEMFCWCGVNQRRDDSSTDSLDSGSGGKATTG